LRSEEFDNASWTKAEATITADNDVGPDGNSTADLITESTNNTTHRVFQAVTTTAVATTVSAYVKPSGRNFVYIRIKDSGNADRHQWFDIGTGALGTSQAGMSATITPAANGYFRCTATISAAFAGANFPVIGLADADNSTTYLGDGSSGVFVWGAQLEELPFASSYIPTTTATVTKTLDDNSIDAANIPALAADYSVCMRFTLLGLDSSKSQVLFNVDGETTRRIQLNTTTGAVEAIHGAVTSTSTSTFSAGDTVDICFVVDGTNQTLYINRAQEDQDAKGLVTGVKTAVDIGHQAGANQAFCNIQSLKIYDVALSATQAASYI
jgi:hypothetical protein